MRLWVREGRGRTLRLVLDASGRDVTSEEAEALVSAAMTELEWCHCARPHEAVVLVLRYLAGVDERMKRLRAGTWQFTEVTDVNRILGYVCDEKGLTEHGGSVGGCWLSAEGERFLRTYRSLLTAEIPA